MTTEEHIGGDTLTMTMQEHIGGGTLTANRYRYFIEDDASDFEKEAQNNVKITHNEMSKTENINTISVRPNVVINNQPENDNIQYKSKKTYLVILYIVVWKNIIILPDSICSRIKMNEFNEYINNGQATMNVFPGAIPKELLHYCIPTLKEGKPDTCILNIGTSILKNDDISEITTDITNIVKRCEYGVNNVYFSTVNCRPQVQVLCNFTLIENGNINTYHLRNGTIHLNNKDIVISARNVIQYIISTHAI